MRPNEYNKLMKKIKCSDDFRSRMQEKLSSAAIEVHEYEDSVSGTEVITARQHWGRIAAMAAAFVLVCGAVGGGAYHLSRIDKQTKESNNISEAVQYASIYTKLKANKELYTGDLTLTEDTDIMYRMIGFNIEPFFIYMDRFDTDNMIEEGDFVKSGRNITINFYEKARQEELDAILAQGGVDMDKISLNYETFYTFTLYDNGYYTMTDNKANRTTYHCFVEGEKVFNDILEMYDDEDTVEQLNTVSETKMKKLLDIGFANDNDGKVFFYPAGTDEPIEYAVMNREGLKKSLLRFEWERSDIPSGDVDLYYLGFTINADGYMQIFIDGIENNFKLKNDSDLEDFRAVLNKQLVPNEFGREASKEDILKLFAGNTGASKYMTDTGQFRNEKDCTVTDYESLKNELSDLEWVTCNRDDENIHVFYYNVGAIISRNGYIISLNSMTDPNAYKLKNEDDIEKLCEILDKYIIKNGDTAIYSNIMAEKEKYTVDISSDTLNKKDVDMNKLVEYFAMYDMYSEIDLGAYVPSDNRIKIYFRKKGEESKDHSYVGTTENYDYKLEIYDNGIFTLTENINGRERMTYHSFGDTDEGKVYSDILQMFADSQ